MKTDLNTSDQHITCLLDTVLNRKINSQSLITCKMASLQLDNIVAPAATDMEDIKQAGVVIEAIPGSEDESSGTVDDWTYPHPTTFKLTEQPIDEIRKMRVSKCCYVGDRTR